MDGVVPFPFDLDVVDRRLGADSELGHGIALQSAKPKAGVAFDERQRASGLGDHKNTREDRCRLSGAVELDEMDRLVEGHTLADAQGDTAGHQGRVERDDAVVNARVHRAKRLLEPGDRLLKSLGERDDFHARRFQPRDVREIGPELPLDHEQAISGKRGDGRSERLFYVGRIDR